METRIGRLVVSSSPHIKSSVTIETAMRDVLIALTPALIMAVYFPIFRFGCYSYMCYYSCGK